MLIQEYKDQMVLDAQQPVVDSPNDNDKIQRDEGKTHVY